MSILDLNAKVEKIFKNPNVNFFIIMNLILIISCYSFIDDPIRKSITYVISHPLITVAILILVIIIGYFNINIAVLALLLFFVALYATPNRDQKLQTNLSRFNNNKNNNIEGFTNEDDTSEADDENDLENTEENNNSPSVVNDFTERNKIKEKKSKDARAKLKKAEEEARKQYNSSSKGLLETKIDSFKDIITNNITKMKENGENQYKQGLLENKHKILDYEMKNSKSQNKTQNKAQKKSSNSVNTNSNKSKNKEDFQTIELRKFDPSNEEDTNLLITKEILKDILNRIEYNYETIPYLKKYVKHRLEEIVQTNNLLKDEDD